MKRILILGATFCALLASGIYAFGDIARPKTSPAPQTKTVLYTRLTVAPDSKIVEARLQMSQGTLQSIARDAAISSSNQSMTQRLMHSSTRTLMSGLFMFLAVSFAGIWFARSSQRRSQKIVAATVLIAAMFGFATIIVRANAGPPGYIYWQRLPANLTKGQSTTAGVNIEIVPGDGSEIKLIVPLRNSNPPGEE